MAAGRVFSRISVECGFKVFELIIELSDVAIISEPSNICCVKLKALLTE